MTSEIRDFQGGDFAVDEWTTQLQTYIRTLAASHTNALEPKQTEILANLMINDNPEEITASIAELKKSLDLSREAGRAVVRNWKVILNITYQNLRRLPTSHQLSDFANVRRSAIKDDSRYLAQAEIWEPRVRMLLRLAPFDFQVSDSTCEHRKQNSARLSRDEIKEIALSQCCPSRMITQSSELLEDRHNTQSRLAPEVHTLPSASLAAANELMYALPKLSIGLLPTSIPSEYELQLLVIISALLNDAVRLSSVQMLDWARSIVDYMLDSYHPNRAHQSDNDGTMALGRTILPNSVLIYVCTHENLSANLQVLELLKVQLAKRYCVALISTSLAEGVQLLEKVPDQDDFSRFLLARTFVEAHESQSFIGDPSLRVVYEQRLNALQTASELQGECAVLALYLETWCCIYDRMSDQGQRVEPSAVLKGAKVTNCGLSRMLRKIRELSDAASSMEATYLMEQPENSQMIPGINELERAVERAPDDDGQQHKAELERVLTYVAGQSGGQCSRGAFTRAVLGMYNHHHTPSWFKLSAFVIWSCWVANLLDIPFIPHYVVNHQKAFPDDTQLTFFDDFRTGVPPPTSFKNGALAQLARIIGASLGNPQMSTLLGAETGMEHAQVSSPQGMLMAFVQSCITTRYI